MSRTISSLILLVALLSCSNLHLEKRRYRKGFFISIDRVKQTKSSSGKENIKCDELKFSASEKVDTISSKKSKGYFNESETNKKSIHSDTLNKRPELGDYNPVIQINKDRNSLKYAKDETSTIISRSQRFQGFRQISILILTSLLLVFSANIIQVYSTSINILNSTDIDENSSRSKNFFPITLGVLLLLIVFVIAFGLGLNGMMVLGWSVLILGSFLAFYIIIGTLVNSNDKFSSKKEKGKKTLLRSLFALLILTSIYLVLFLTL